MSDPLSLVGRIASIRDELIEAKRYVLTDPRPVADCIKHAAVALTECRIRAAELATPIGCLVGNLVEAYQCLLSNPDAANAYLTVVVHELGRLRSDLEREAAAPARDRELAEAYGAPSTQ